MREVLANVVSNPRQYSPPLDMVASEVVREVRKRFVKLALKHKDSGRLVTVLDDILFSEYSNKQGIISHLTVTPSTVFR